LHFSEKIKNNEARQRGAFLENTPEDFGERKTGLS